MKKKKVKKIQFNKYIIYTLAILIVIAGSFFIDGITIGHKTINKGWKIEKTLPVDVKLENIVREKVFQGDIIMKSWEEDINGVYTTLAVYSLSNCRDGSLIEEAGNPLSKFDLVKNEAKMSKVEIQFQEIVRGLKVEIRRSDEDAEILGISKCYKIKD